MKSGGTARVVAIDGPGGAGKSTVAKLVAEATGLRYLDTGAMYRAITFAVLACGVDPADWAAVAELLPSIAIDVGESEVSVDGVDATEAIRGPEVTAHVSAVAANPAVRAELVRLQQQWIAAGDGGVLEGRDIGTVVAPAAAVKVYVTASVRERARRRSIETGAAIDAVEADLIRRDALDSGRAESPLRPADDAVHIDTTEHTIPEVAAMIVDLVVAAGLVEIGPST